MRGQRLYGKKFTFDVTSGPKIKDEMKNLLADDMEWVYEKWCGVTVMCQEYAIMKIDGGMTVRNIFNDEITVFAVEIKKERE